MLFVLPVSWVPLAVAAGLALGELAAGGRQVHHLARVAVLPANAWHAVGPALVLLAAGEPDPDLALLAGPRRRPGLPQFAFDYASSAARGVDRVPPAAADAPALHGLGLDPRRGARPGRLRASALAAVNAPASVLLVLPLIGLLGVFARQRQVGIDRALELGHAYRGTAFLLGDVVEADDSYTGTHCRDVVELVLAVADQARRRRPGPPRRGVRRVAPRRRQDPHPQGADQQARER